MFGDKKLFEFHVSLFVDEKIPGFGAQLVVEIVSDFVRLFVDCVFPCLIAGLEFPELDLLLEASFGIPGSHVDLNVDFLGALIGCFRGSLLLEQAQIPRIIILRIRREVPIIISPQN